MFIDDELFFMAETINHGRQLWSSNGEVTGLEDFLEKEKLILYPNPTIDYIDFKNDKEKITNYKIVDLQGRDMKVNLNEENKIYVGNLTPGLYILIAVVDNKKIVRKFIKN